MRGDDLPRKPERITFENKSADFVLTVTYDEMSTEMLPPGESRDVAKYTVRVPADLVTTGPKSVRVTFALDKHGWVNDWERELNVIVERGLLSVFICITISLFVFADLDSTVSYDA
jgi:uncharacterized membrane protein